MPITRSASRTSAPNSVDASSTKKRARQDSTTTATLLSKPAFKKQRATKASTSGASTSKVVCSDEALIPQALAPPSVGADDSPVLSSTLAFSFEDARTHLIQADSRFQDLFDKLECKPFEKLERVHPYRALVESILGQQISWLAARSIKHKFIRLFDPSIPEKLADYSGTFFPTPLQVSQLDIPTLKSAGLSTRKAEYILDLATRFSDGRLSTEKIFEANDEELTEMLTAVRGIGVWTVHMFAMFSLRRPDVLPVGDLGVQRGMLRWFLALHSPAHPFTLSPEKINQSGRKSETQATAPGDTDALPTLSDPKSTGTTGDDENSVQLEAIPPAFTPSIKKTLASEQAKETRDPLPEGITLELLKSRLQGKKVKGAFLTPKEMEDLTESWKPYRSIGVYYMWSLADPKGK